MKNPRFNKVLAIGLVAAGVVGWIALTGFLTRFHEGAETVAIASPIPDRHVVVPPGRPVGWQGSANTPKDCTAGSPSPSSAPSPRVPVGKGPFVAKTPPLKTYGDQLIWLDVECDERWETQYARKVIVQEKLKDRTEVARVHFQPEKMVSWLGKQIDENEDLEKVIKETKFDPDVEASMWQDFHPTMIDADLRSVRISVANGFHLTSLIWSKFWVTCEKKGNLFGFVPFRRTACPNKRGATRGFHFEITARLKTTFTVSKKMKVAAKDTSIKLIKFKVIDSEAVRAKDKEKKKKQMKDMQEDLDEKIPNIEIKIKNYIQKTLDRIIIIMTKDAGPLIVNLIENKNIGDRLINFLEGANFSFARSNSGNRGEHLYFSVSVSSKWLRRQGPELRFNRQDPNHPIGLMVSYTLINRALETFMDRDLREVVREIAEGARAFGLTGGIEKFNFETVSTLAGYRDEFDKYLSRMGLRYDDTLSFRVPISVRPLGHHAVRFSIADARMFRGTGAQRDIAIGVWGEGNVGFGRTTTYADVKHLARHLAFDPVVIGGSSVSSSELKRYRATTGLTNRIIRGEGGWTESGGLPFDLGRMKESLADLLQGAKLETPIELGFGQQGQSGFTVQNIYNNTEQHALVVYGKLFGKLLGNLK